MLIPGNTEDYTISLTLYSQCSHIFFQFQFPVELWTQEPLFFSRLIEFNHGNVPVTFKQFESVVNRLDSPDDCVPCVDEDLFASCVTPIDENHDDLYGVPSYEALVLDEEEHEQGEWIGGETEALRRLKVFEEEVSIIFTADLQTLRNDCHPIFFFWFRLISLETEHGLVCVYNLCN